MNVFRYGDEFVIALTYGRDSDWVRNVLAAGGCEIETRGVWRSLLRPRVITDPGASLAPGPIRPLLRAIGVSDFLVLTQDAGPRGTERAS